MNESLKPLWLEGMFLRPQHLQQHDRWIEATLEILALLPPVGVIADLGRLLTRGPFDIAASEVVPDPELRAALGRSRRGLLVLLAAVPACVCGHGHTATRGDATGMRPGQTRGRQQGGPRAPPPAGSAPLMCL